MEFVFTSKDLLRLGIIIYVGIWLCFAVAFNIYTRSNKHLDVHKANFYYFWSAFSRHWGYVAVGVLIILAMGLLPEVHVVKRDADDTFKKDRYFTLFKYNSHACKPFGVYLSNESDSMLAIYNTTLTNGRFMSVTSKDNIDEIAPGEFLKLDQGLSHSFSRPYESSTSYVSESRRDKTVTESTLDLKSDALRDIDIIEKKIKGISTITYHHLDSAEIANRVREKLLRQVLENIKENNEKHGE